MTWDVPGFCNVRDETLCYIPAWNFVNSFIFCSTSGVILKRQTCKGTQTHRITYWFKRLKCLFCGGQVSFYIFIPWFIESSEFDYFPVCQFDKIQWSLIALKFIASKVWTLLFVSYICNSCSYINVSCFVGFLWLIFVFSDHCFDCRGWMWREFDHECWVESLHGGGCGPVHWHTMSIHGSD